MFKIKYNIFDIYKKNISCEFVPKLTTTYLNPTFNS